MQWKYKKKEYEWCGKSLIFESGKVAKQANGAVMISSEDTTVLVVVVASDKPKEDIDFFPLFCDYREKTYAAGKIPGGFFKREGKPTETETLISRLIDRPIRPLFPEGFKNEVQVYATVLSYDSNAPSDIIALNGASVALMISDVPFLGPIAAVRVCHDGKNFIINPSIEEIDNSIMDIVLAGTETEITMVEGGAKEIPEEMFLEAVKIGHKYIKKCIEYQKDFYSDIAREKMKFEPELLDEELYNEIKKLAVDKINSLVGIKDKQERNNRIKEILENVIEALSEKYPEQENKIKSYFYNIEKEEVRKYIFTTRKRIDGREFDEIRPVSCEVGILKRTHGSALFTRGQTQSLGLLTLGASSDEQIQDDLYGEIKKHFMLHYNFPSWSVGECGFPRGVGRREIGHGHLAERALEAVLPSKEEFPYTIRIVSEILESNGSSSMATVCSGCLCLMDGGVPIKDMVAGIAMGLIKEGDEYIILTDIQGAEDHYGDMDFKVAGTRKGITAIQMDIKIKGLPIEIMAKALEQARKARLFILDKMSEVIDKPRPELSPYAPKIKSVRVEPLKIPDLIGPAGRNIKKIIEETNTTIDIQEDGLIFIFGETKEEVEKAAQMIIDITSDVEVGKLYKGKVVRVENYGAFVSILPGKLGLVHVSELDLKRIRNAKDVCKVGDEIDVKVLKIDDQNRIVLSRKEALKELRKKVNK